MTSSTAVIVLCTLISIFVSRVNALGGSATTVAISYGVNITICGIVAGQPSQRIQCWRNGQVFPVFYNISFESISGGRDVFCGVRSGGSTLVCWDTQLVPKRIYYNETLLLRHLSIGDRQICGITNATDPNVYCWRNGRLSGRREFGFRSVSSGLGFTCGVMFNDSVGCFGIDSVSARGVQEGFAGFGMLSIGVGGGHACGVNSTGFLICRGNNDYRQIDVPQHSAFEFHGLALGANHTCALRRRNNSVVCWGGSGGEVNDDIASVSFETIVAGLDFTCGLTTDNFSVVCWGVGWVRNDSNPLGFDQILPGPCVRSSCPCAIFPQSSSLCSGDGSICRPCDIAISAPPVPALGPPSPPRTSSEVNGGAPISLVDYAVPIIMAGELEKILDKRVGMPEVNEAEAVELMAYTALHCVNSEGMYRPTMTDIVANLERALGLCSGSHGSMSSSD
ncbi:regulator of chromosome condensation 1/beta-lactamase-inhibitor protein II [Artemisia annua]|uniref:non-specific serine/threonine protein kinase n=1 Tax=Artemisia annua TaxID=35608 RepID=A0A2U1LFW5_ARTAN|nr:regulator of chromosome condensation 1/beta-lactamase-inhibitor protein II [Artemisia annua]